MHILNKYFKGDKTIWIVVFLLSMFSVISVYSSISSLAVKNSAAGPEYYLFRHIAMLGIGWFMMFQIHRMKLGHIARLGQILIWLVIPLLLFTILKGSDINNAKRWITIPIINTTFQTSDLAKLVLVLYISRILAVNHADLKDWRKVMMPITFVIFMVCGLIFPANFSTAAMLFISCFALIFVAGIPMRHIASVMFMCVGLIGIVLAISTVKPDLLPRVNTWKARVENFGNDDKDGNYQAEHAKYAIAAGGILPNGPGKGNSRNFLPHPYSDMIFAFMIEEMGSILGGLLVIILYLVILRRSISISLKTDRPFGGYAAFGLAFLLCIQAFINMGVSVNLFPVTGQPLPLISLGGTSTIFTCMSIGVILNVSRTLEENQTENSKGGNYAFA